MPLKRYLSIGNIELLKREVKFSTGIQLKALFCWLINKNCLRKQQETDNKWKLAIVIIIKGDAKAKKLCISDLRFRKVIRVVERYWEAESSSIYIICCGISQY